MKHLLTLFLFLLISETVLAQDDENPQESFTFSDCADCSDTLMLTYKRISKDEEIYKAGYYNRKGQLVIPRIYDYASAFYGGKAIVGLGEKYGIIDMQGKFVLPLKYSKISNLGRAGYEVLLEGRCGLLDYKGNVRIPIGYEEINIWNWEDSLLFKIRDRGKLGLYNLETHKWLIPPRYTQFHKDYNAIFAEVYTGKIHWINGSNYGMIDSTYQHIWSLGNRMYGVRKNNLIGAVDSLNHVIIPLEYKGLLYFQFTNLLIGIKDGKQGLITYDNRIVQDFIYDGIYYSNIRSGLIIVEKNGLYGLLNETGTKLVAHCIYKQIVAESKDSIFVKNSSDLYGIIQQDGTIIENCIYDFYNPERSSHNLIYRKENKYGLFDFNQMKFLTRPEFDEMKLLSTEHQSSQYLVRKGKEKMVLNESGKLMFKVNSFDEILLTGRYNVYIALKNKKYGLIDDKGKILLPCNYELIIADDGFMIYVFDKGKYYKMNLTGELEIKLLPCE